MYGNVHSYRIKNKPWQVLLSQVYLSPSISDTHFLITVCTHVQLNPTVLNFQGKQ